MTEFKFAPHGIRNEEMIEVFMEGQFVASIYAGPDGIKIVTKFPMRARAPVTTEVKGKTLTEINVDILPNGN